MTRRRATRETPQMLFNRRLMRTALLLCLIFLLLQGAAFMISFQYTVGDMLSAWDMDSLDFAQRTVASATLEFERYLQGINGDARLVAMVNEYDESTTSPYQSKFLSEMVSALLLARSVGYDAYQTSFIYQDGRIWGAAGHDTTVDAGVERHLATITGEGVQLFILPEGQDGRVTLGLAAALGSAFDVPGYAVMIMRPNWLATVLEEDEELSIYAPEAGVYLYKNKRAAALTQPPIADGIARTMDGLRVISVADSDMGWEYVLSYPVERQQRTLTRMLWIAGLGLTLGIAMALGLARLFSVRVTMSLTELHSLSLRYEKAVKRPTLWLHTSKRRFGDTVIIYLVAVCLMPMLLYMGMNSLSVAAVMQDITGDSAQRLARQTARTTNAFFNSIQRTSLGIILDYGLQTELREGGDGTAFWLAGQTLPRSWEMALYDLTGKQYASTFVADDVMPKALYASLHTDNQPYPQWQLEGESIRLWRRVNNMQSSNSVTQRMAYFMLDVPADALGADEQRADEVQLCVVDSAGNVVLGVSDWTHADDYEALYSGAVHMLMEPGHCLVAVPLKYEGLRLVLRISRAGMVSDQQQILTINAIALLIGLSIVLFVAYRMSQRFSRSIEILRQNLLEWTPDKALGADSGVDDGEIVAIARMFNEMSARITDLVAQTYEMRIGQMEQESRVRQAEYYALQAQINPHFLYNTLESIKYTIREGQTKSAVDMLDLLGDLFRAAVDKNTFVPLEQEIFYAKAYIRLQCIRFEERLRVKWHVDDAMLGIGIPRLVLQPIFENAIVHGMQGGRATLSIEIRAWEAVDTLCIEIVNDGQPVQPEQLAALSGALANPELSEGIGLVNVHRRLRYYYGEDYGASVAQAEGGRFSVRLTLPKRPYTSGLSDNEGK